MTISSQDFKETLAHLAGAVTVITTCDVEGQPRGFTATSFCSVSLEPPLVLCCLSTDADCYAAFADARYFAVNILTKQQEAESQRFAFSGSEKYRGVAFERGQTGMPLLANSLATLECSLYAKYPGGDHIIILGLVEHGNITSSEEAGKPLLYYAHQYGTFASLPRDIEE